MIRSSKGERKQINGDNGTMMVTWWCVWVLWSWRNKLLLLSWSYTLRCWARKNAGKRFFAKFFGKNKKKNMNTMMMMMSERERERRSCWCVYIKRYTIWIFLLVTPDDEDDVDFFCSLSDFASLLSSLLKNTGCCPCCWNEAERDIIQVFYLTTQIRVKNWTSERNTI